MFAISPMPGSRGTFEQSISSDVCGDARSSAWLPRPKPVRSVQAWTFSRSSFGKSGGTAFSFAMFSSAAFTFSGAKSPAFIAVTAMAGADGLCEQQAVALARRAYGPHSLGVHLAEYDEAVLRLFVLHAVSAREHRVGLDYLVCSAVQYLLKDGDRLARGREAYDVERDQRLAAHRVDVAQRVRRGDFAEAPRVVYDRRINLSSVCLFCLRLSSTAPRPHRGSTTRAACRS